VALWEHPGIHLVYPTPTQGTGESEDGDVTDIARVLDEKRLDAFAKYRFSRKASIRIARARATIARAASKPFESPFDVFIFHDAHAMREEAQNALLKLVEEPPVHVAIIFITSNPEGVLYTIRSRCQQVRFHPLKTTVLERVLRDYYHSDEKLARRAAAMAQGSLVRARQLTEQFDDSDREAALSFVEHLAKSDEAWAVGQGLASGRGANRESVARFLDEVSLVFRDIMAGDKSLYINADLAPRLSRLSKAWPASHVPGAIHAIYRARHDIFVRNTTIDATLAGLFLSLRRRALGQTGRRTHGLERND